MLLFLCTALHVIITSGESNSPRCCYFSVRQFMSFSVSVYGSSCHYLFLFSFSLLCFHFLSLSIYLRQRSKVFFQNYNPYVAEFSEIHCYIWENLGTSYLKRQSLSMTASIRHILEKNIFLRFQICFSSIFVYCC